MRKKTEITELRDSLKLDVEKEVNNFKFKINGFSKI